MDPERPIAQQRRRRRRARLSPLQRSEHTDLRRVSAAASPSSSQSEPSAGYSWQVANKLDPAVLTPLGTQLRSESPGIPGAPAQQYISFAANGVGSATIEVHYVSPDGRPSTDPAPMTFNVTVTFDGLAATAATARPGHDPARTRSSALLRAEPLARCDRAHQRPLRREAEQPAVLVPQYTCPLA